MDNAGFERREPSAFATGDGEKLYIFVGIEAVITQQFRQPYVARVASARDAESLSLQILHGLDVRRCEQGLPECIHRHAKSHHRYTLQLRGGHAGVRADEK